MERLNRLPAATLASGTAANGLSARPGMRRPFLIARNVDLDANRDPAALLGFGQRLQRFWLCRTAWGWCCNRPWLPSALPITAARARASPPIKGCAPKRPRLTMSCGSWRRRLAACCSSAASDTPPAKAYSRDPCDGRYRNCWRVRIPSRLDQMKTLPRQPSGEGFGSLSAPSQRLATLSSTYAVFR